jgi:hypothetical protein
LHANLQRDEIKPILTYLANPGYLITLLILVAVAPFLSGCFIYQNLQTSKNNDSTTFKTNKKSEAGAHKNQKQAPKQDIARSKS